MRKSDQTRQFIIERAAPVFNRYGYEGTSMARLTRAINMTKGAIYGNFRDKDEIALAAFRHNMGKITREIGQIIRADKPTCDRLIDLAGFYLDDFSRIAGDGGCPILNAAVDSDHVHPGLKQAVLKAIDRWMSAVAGLVAEGMDKGEITRQTRPDAFATLFVSLVEGGMMLSKATGNTIHLGRNVDHIIHLVNSELRVL